MGSALYYVAIHIRPLDFFFSFPSFFCFLSFFLSFRFFFFSVVLSVLEFFPSFTTTTTTTKFSFLSSSSPLPFRLWSSLNYHLVGLVVRRPPRQRKVPGSNPACAGIFSGSSHTSDFKIGTPVAALPGAWRYRVSTGTGRPGVSML